MSWPGRLWQPVAGLATLATYNTWVLWSPLNGHGEIFSGYLSEFSAFDQPHNLFFRGGDRITAVLVGALGVRALLSSRRLPAHRRWWLVSAAGLVLFAVATFLDSYFSMDCSPSLSARCRALEEAGRLSLTHYAHTYTSVGAQTGIVTSMVAAYLAMASSGTGGPRWRRVVLAICIGEGGLLTIMLGMLALGVPGFGFPQAGMVALASMWFAGVGVALGRPSREPTSGAAVVKHRASYAG